MEKTEKSFVANVLPDKCLLGKVRKIFIERYETKNGSGLHKHEDKRRLVFPESIFCSEVGDDQIFFVSTSSLNKPEEKEPMPIFMLEMKGLEKREIISCANENGLDVRFKHFFKPKIAISYADQLEA